MLDLEVHALYMILIITILPHTLGQRERERSVIIIILRQELLGQNTPLCKPSRTSITEQVGAIKGSKRILLACSTGS